MTQKDAASEPEKPTKVRLAEAMSEIRGMPPFMLQRAIDGYYHDFESPLPFPEMQLVSDLRGMASLPTTGPKAKQALNALARRVINGEFDASRAESDAWMASEEGQQVMRELLGNAPESSAPRG